MILCNKVECMEDYYERKVGENFEFLNKQIDELFISEENKYQM